MRRGDKLGNFTHNFVIELSDILQSRAKRGDLFFKDFRYNLTFYLLLDLLILKTKFREIIFPSNSQKFL